MCRKKSPKPTTGDNADMFAYIALLVAATVLGGVCYKRRKEY